MAATPDLTLTVTTPAGVVTDYTNNLTWSGSSQSNTINQNFGRQGDTAVFSLVDEFENPADQFHIEVFSQVKLVDNFAGKTLFAGVCNDPIFTNTAPTRNEWTLNCTDYTFYADNAVVHGTFTGDTVDQIVVQLTTEADCGIVARLVADGGFVQTGPQLAIFVQNYDSLSSSWRKLSQLAGSVTPYGWYVDENRELHFFDATSATSSGVTFTTFPTSAGDGSLTEGHFGSEGSFSYEYDGTSLRNQILVQGSNQTIYFGDTTNDPTDTWLGNGSQSAWPMRFTLNGTPTLWVNDSPVTVTVVESGAVASTDQWQAVSNSIGQWFLINNTAAPALGVVLKLWYDYDVPVVARVNDYPSQALFDGPNNGVFVEYISDSSLTTVPMALARAQRERQEYAFPVGRINFNTTEEFMGWVRAGETCYVVNQFIPDDQNGYNPGINDTFLVVSNSATFGIGGYRQNSVTAVRVFLGPNVAYGYGSGAYGDGPYGGATS